MTHHKPGEWVHVPKHCHETRNVQPMEGEGFFARLFKCERSR